MNNTTKPTRLEFLLGVFKHDYQKAIEKNLYVIPQPKFGFKVGNDLPMIDYLCDREFLNFYHNFYADKKLPGNTPLEILFNFFVDCDPSENKEYVSWLINLYRITVKDRVSIRDGYTDNTLTIYEINNFFEDAITKIKASLEMFSYLKRLNFISVENRDINKFKSFNSFIESIRPYMSGEEGDDSVHTFDKKELDCIHNFIKNGGKQSTTPGIAELIYEDNDWVIVITHDKEANTSFGKFTTWCTAGTRWGSMFDSYHGRGELFVLIKKGYGSKKSIKQHPEFRLQFHFEDNQFMDANDRRINVNTFMDDNNKVKLFFETYLIKTALPKRRAKKVNYNDEIKYLLDIGYGDRVIKILKDSNLTEIDFSEHSISSEYLNEIGQITTLEKLTLNKCKLTELPESIKDLKNLTYLKFRSNKDIKEIPQWISELTKLEYLDFGGCDVVKLPDFSKNTNITDLIFDANENLKEFPKGIGTLTNLQRLTASDCDLLK